MGLRFKGFFMAGSIGLISTAILKMQTDNLLLVALCAHADQVHTLTSGISCVFAQRRPSFLPSITLKCELRFSELITENMGLWVRGCVQSQTYTLHPGLTQFPAPNLCCVCLFITHIREDQLCSSHRRAVLFTCNKSVSFHSTLIEQDTPKRRNRSYPATNLVLFKVHPLFFCVQCSLFYKTALASSTGFCLLNTVIISTRYNNASIRLRVDKRFSLHKKKSRLKESSPTIKCHQY